MHYVELWMKRTICKIYYNISYIWMISFGGYIIC